MPFHLDIDYLLGMAGWLALLGVSLPLLLGRRRRWKERHPGRIKWINAGLSVWVFLAAITLVELYFAVIYDRTDAFNATKVSLHWFARHVRPRVLRFKDGLGHPYRDAKEFPATLAPGQHSICFIGDSFTFGHGIVDVADRFSDRIAADLEKKRPGRFVVSNLSDAGRDLQYAELLLGELIADRYPLQTVVYVVCLNDIETFEPPKPSVEKKPDWLRDSFLVRNTYFFNLAYTRTRRSGEAGIHDYYSILKDDYEAEPWEKMKQKFDDIQQLCAEAHVDLRVVIFPFVHNLGPDYPFRHAHQVIAEHCREIGLPVLDLLPVLEAHASENLTVNPLDAHPNERAHALAAEAIEKDLLGDVVAK